MNATTAMTPLAPTVRNAYQAQFAACAASLPGAGVRGLARLRQHAFERFAELGLPSTQDEDWKYTSVATLTQQIFRLADPESAGRAAKDIDPALLASLVLPGHARLVFIDGRHAPALSDLSGLAALSTVSARSARAELAPPPGVVVGSLASELAAPSSELLDWLTKAESNAFAALNTALWSDGAYLDLAAGTQLALPLQLLFLTTANNAVADQDLAVNTRNLIRLGAGASAEIVEHHVGGSGRYFSNSATRIELGPGAQLIHNQLQEEGPRAIHIANLDVRQAQDSTFDSRAFALGGQLARSDLTTRFEAAGCTATLLGLYLADGRRHVDHHTRIDHASPYGTSRQLYKGVLDGGGRAVFNGKVIVHADAQHSDAEQSNRNLLLSEHAEIDTKPQLEIYADDVKCSHGATVGQLDDEQLHYLRARGIGRAAARALLTYAFAAEVLTPIGTPALRARLEQLLQMRLGHSPEDGA